MIATLLAACWIIAALGALLSLWIPYIRERALQYGKLADIAPSAGGRHRIWDAHVPRLWFWMYYAASLLFSMVACAVVRRWPELVPPGPANRLCLVLFAMQALRRLHECRFVQRGSTRTMHWLILALGLAHYLGAAATLLFAAPVSAPAAPLLQTSGIALFIFSSWKQHQLHRILADLRAPGAAYGDGYAVPHRDWFACTVCPHYTAELGIYASFVVITAAQSFAVIVMAIWVLTNLSINAVRTRRWYAHKFRGHAAADRWAILPGVL